MADAKLNIIINGVDKASGVFGGISKAMGGMATVAGGILAAGAIQQIGTQFIQMGKDSIQSASDLGETWNKVNTIFGEGTGQLKDAVSEWGTQLGQSTQSMLDGAATFGVFGKSAGLAGNDLADFSMDMVELSSDLASFHNTSPEEAIQALGAALRGESEPMRRYGVLLDDATMRQKALELGIIKTTKDALTPAQKVLAAQALIMEQTADAQGDFLKTSDGLANQQRIMTANWKNMQATVGAALLPLMTKFSSVLNGLFSNPVFQAGLQSFIAGLTTLVDQVLAGFPLVVAWFESAFGWLMDNQGVIVGVLAAIGVAIGAFVYTAVIPALLAFITAAAPVIAVMALVGAAAYLLYTAWTTNFGGIQEKAAAVWASVQPALQTLYNWLQVNIPAALAWLANVWQTVLLPAIMQVWTWVQTVAFPIAATLFNWLQVNLPLALQTLSTFWTTVLWPAIQDVWSWMDTVLFPFLEALGNFLSAAFTLVLTALAGTWQNVLLPAIQAVYNFLVDSLKPTFEGLGTWLTDTFFPIISTAATWIGTTLVGAFNGLNTVLGTVMDWLNEMATKLGSLHLPDWMTPGSPTPWEIGLRGVGQALDELTRTHLPRFEAELDFKTPIGAAASAAGGVTNVTNYTMNTYTNQTPRVVQSGFALMRAMSAV
jgi:hypothetical protein